jgi:hypothetical protein
VGASFVGLAGDSGAWANGMPRLDWRPRGCCAVELPARLGRAWDFLRLGFLEELSGHCELDPGATFVAVAVGAGAVGAGAAVGAAVDAGAGAGAGAVAVAVAGAVVVVVADAAVADDAGAAVAGAGAVAVAEEVAVVAPKQADAEGAHMPASAPFGDGLDLKVVHLAEIEHWATKREVVADC